MSIEQYWIGKDLDLDGLWSDYDSGSGYMNKVAANPLHLLSLTFVSTIGIRPHASRYHKKQISFYFLVCMHRMLDELKK